MQSPLLRYIKRRKLFACISALLGSFILHVVLYFELPAGSVKGNKLNSDPDSTSTISLKIQNIIPAISHKNAKRTLLRDPSNPKNYPNKLSKVESEEPKAKTSSNYKPRARKSEVVGSSGSRRVPQISTSKGKPIVAPKRIRFKQPELTRAARRAMVEGIFRVELSIDAEGKVLNAKMRDLVGFGMDSRIEQAMRNAQFSPAKNSSGVEVASKLIDSVEIIQL